MMQDTSSLEVAALLVRNMDALIQVVWYALTGAIVFIVALVAVSWRMSRVFHGFQTTLSRLEASMGNIMGRTQNIENHLFTLNGHFGKDVSQFCAYTATNSPISLTDEGLGLLRDSGFSQFIQDHPSIIDVMLDSAGERKDIEAYIESMSFRKAVDLFETNDPRVADVSSYLFQHGLRHHQGRYDAILQAFGVALRNAAFAKMGVDIPQQGII